MLHESVSLACSLTKGVSLHDRPVMFYCLCKIPMKTVFLGGFFPFCTFILILLYKIHCVQTHLSISAVVLCGVPNVPITMVSKRFLIHSI